MLSRACEIRLLHQDDIPLIVAAFAELGWDKPTSLYQQYLTEQETHQRCVWVAFNDGVFLGYITLKWYSEYAPFHQQNIPEIVDLNVLPKFRKQGIGDQLMEKAYQFAVENNAKEIQLNTYFPGAHAFFLVLGFETVAVIPNWKYGLDCYLMRRKI